MRYEGPGEEKPPLVPDGKYEFAYLYYETGHLFNGRQPKLIIWFRIVSMGPHFGTALARYYNIKKLIGKPGPEGRYKVSGWRTDIVREYTNVLDAPSRLDRLNWGRLNDYIVVGRVRTVRRDFRQREIHPDLQYSVVAELLGSKR